ncbi:MAG: NAD-dependent epimerase/dehydratase family protein [Bdellovibrionales bacterium]|nr:NAD-dependent epimerase/dehydratase family protein [Bdellovibrionales bacterium]
MKVVIAGSTGFIGKSLIASLNQDPRIEAIFALSRSPRPANANEPKIVPRRSDLADLESVRKGVRGSTAAIYLVHSMSPQARLDQGRFDDFDLHQADNFARACALENVERIFYLGGIIPASSQNESKWSAHLRSRLEVERVLGTYGAITTSFRAGLVIGNGGSSSEMLIRLVRRLPVMLAPTWTQTRSEPVDLQDVVYAIHQTLFRPDLQNQSWDLTAEEVVSYRWLMQETAKLLGLRRSIIPVPVLSPGVSKLWVSTVSGAPRALVYPLVKSLTYEMISRPDRRILPLLSKKPTSIHESLRRMASAPSSVPTAYRPKVEILGARTVRSIQRIPNIDSEKLKSIGSIAERYFEWLPRFLFKILTVQKDQDASNTRIRFLIRLTSIVLLELKSLSESGKVNEIFQIQGGLLKKKGTGGILEFRPIPSENCVLSIVQDFVPSLPWPVYRWTQAVIHLWVMNRFGNWISQSASIRSAP